jgi:hypothetical protein
MKTVKSFIKRKDVWYQLACPESSNDYQAAKNYADTKGLKYVHRGGNLFVEANGVTPDTLKEYGCANLEGLYAYILRLEDYVIASLLISHLNATQVKSLWDIIQSQKETKTIKMLIDLCFRKMAILVKGE